MEQVALFLKEEALRYGVVGTQESLFHKKNES
jgi:hypothetical protein